MKNIKLLLSLFVLTILTGCTKESEEINLRTLIDTGAINGNFINVEYANKLMENFNTSTPIIISDIDKILSTSLFLLSGTDVTIDNLSEYIKTLLQPLKAFISDSRLVDCSVQVVSCVSDVGV